MAITPPRFNPDISGFTDTPEIPSPRVPAVRPAADAPEEQQDDSLLNNEIGMPDGDASSLHRIRAVDPFATPTTGIADNSPLAYRFGPALDDSRQDDTFGPENTSDILGEGNTTILAPRRSNRGTLRDSILGTPVAYTGERSHVQFQLSEASPDSTPAGYNSFLDHSHEDTLALIRPIETQFGPRPARIFDANRSAERLVPYRDPDAPPAAPVTAPAQTRAPISRLQILRDSEASAAGPSASTTPTRTLRPRSTDGRTFGTALTVPSATDTPEQPRSVSKWDQNKNQPLPRTGDAIWQEYPSPVNMTPDVMFKWHNWPPRKESDPALQNMNRFRLPFPKDAPQNAEPESELNRLQEAEKTLNPFRPWENLSEEELLAVPLPVVLLSPEVTDAILVAFQTHLVDEKIAEAGKTEKIPFAGPPPPENLSNLPGPTVESDLRKPFTENVPRVRIPEHIQYPALPSVVPGSTTREMPSSSNTEPEANLNPVIAYVRGSSDDILTLNDEPHVPYISSGLSSSTDISEGAIASRRTIVHNPADIHSDPAMSVLDHEYDNLLKYHHEDTPNYWAEVLKENKPWVMDHTARILNSLPEQRLENDPKMAVVPSSAVLAFVQNYKDPGPQPKVTAPWERKTSVQTAETETGTSSPSPSRPPAWHALTDQVDKTKPFVPRENRTDEEERALDEDIARNEQELEKNFRMQREMVAYGSDFRRQYDPAKSAAHRTEREKFNAAQQRWDDRFDPPLSKQTVVNTKTYAGASANRQRCIREGTKTEQEREKRVKEVTKIQTDMLCLALIDAEMMQARRVWMVSVAQEKTKAIKEGRKWKPQSWQKAIPRSEVVAAAKNAQKALKAPVRRPQARNAAVQSALRVASTTVGPKISSGTATATSKSGAATSGASSVGKSLIITLKVPPASLQQIASSTAASEANLAPGMIDINTLSTSEVTLAPSANKRKRATGAEDTPDAPRPPPKKRTTTRSRNGANPYPILPTSTAAALPTITEHVTDTINIPNATTNESKERRGNAVEETAQSLSALPTSTDEYTGITGSVENPASAAPTTPAAAPAKKARPSRSKKVIDTENTVTASVQATHSAQNNSLPTNSAIAAAENSVPHAETTIPSKHVAQPVLSVKNAKTPRAKKQTSKVVANSSSELGTSTINDSGSAALSEFSTPAVSKAPARKRAPRVKAAISATAAIVGEAAAAQAAAPLAVTVPTNPSLIVTLKVKVPPSLSFDDVQAPFPTAVEPVAEADTTTTVRSEVTIPEPIPKAASGKNHRSTASTKIAKPPRQGQPRGRAALAAAAAAAAAACSSLDAADPDIPAPVISTETSIAAPVAPTSSEAISDTAFDVTPAVIAPAPVPTAANKRKRTTNENVGASAGPVAKKRLTKKEGTAIAAAADEADVAALPAPLSAPLTSTSDNVAPEALPEDAVSAQVLTVVAPDQAPAATNKRKRTTGASQNAPAKKRVTKKGAVAIAAAGQLPQQELPASAQTPSTVEPSTAHAQSLVQGAILFAQNIGLGHTDSHQQTAQQQVVDQVVQQVEQQAPAIADPTTESTAGAADVESPEKESEQQQPRQKAGSKKTAPRKPKKAASRKTVAKKAPQPVLPQAEDQQVQVEVDSQLQEEFATTIATSIPVPTGTNHLVTKGQAETKAPVQRRKKVAPAPVPTTRVTRSRAKKD